MNAYLDELVQFIHKKRIIESPIYHKEVELLDDGTSNVKLSFHCKISETNESLPFSIKQSMIFMLLDAHIDNINPEMSNGNFKNKYESLNERNKNDEILKEIYRIFRFIRNNIIHDMNSIINKDQEIIIHGIKNSILRMNECTIKIMNYIVYIIVFNDMGNAYNSLILQNLYEKFRAGVIEFKDDITDNKFIKSIEADVKFKNFNRSILIGAKSRTSKNNSILEIDLYKDITPYESEDYLVEVNREFYFLPNEMLEKNSDLNIGKVSISNINKFKLDINNPTIDILVWGILKKNILK